MKLQDVILKAMAKKISWIEAADRGDEGAQHATHEGGTYQEHGYNGLFDQRKGKCSIHRVPTKTAEQVLSRYQQDYFDFSMRHFHERLGEEHVIKLS